MFCCATVSSSCSEMTDVRLVNFSMVMSSLPVGGMATRITCGRMTLRIVWGGVMPRLLAAIRCSGSTASSAERRISAM